MKKIMFILLVLACWFSPVFAGQDSPAGDSFTEVGMAYCTITDLYGAYGQDRITSWSRLNPDVVDKAINDASAEIDSYLFSGGYAIPLPGAPKSITKYCIDIASANLLVRHGVFKDDAGGQAVLDESKKAIRFLEKVAKGEFRIPGFTPAGETARPPSGGVLVSAPPRLDLRGY
jgi:phage gp36-like protein